MSLTQHSWGDIPVPYVALWSSEMEPYIAHCRYAEAFAVFSHGARGDGKPVFGKMHELRQRECVARKLCQVCRCKLDGLSYAMEVPDQIVLGMICYPLLTEPPVCRECAVYSLQNCPGITRQRDSADFRCYEIADYVLVQQWLKPANDGAYPKLDHALTEFGRPAVGYLKYALTKYRETSL